MNILGLDRLVFGVDDLSAARQYLLDYGLDEAAYTPGQGGLFTALDGTGIEIRHSDDPGLPPLPPGAHSPCLRETVYGVPDAAIEDLELALENARWRRDRLGMITLRSGASRNGFGAGTWREPSRTAARVCERRVVLRTMTLLLALAPPMLRSPASRMTGTSSPRSVSTAMPRCSPRSRCWSTPPPPAVAWRSGLSCASWKAAGDADRRRTA